MAETLSPWLTALEARHRAALRPAEFLKAVRALSARYVERRDELSRRSALDSAGKRAAFAAFFAPLHFLTTTAIVRELGADRTALRTIVDLGCGTGVASAAWAAAHRDRPAVLGIDRDPWALDEARWNWRELGIEGRVRRGDIVQHLRAAGAGPTARTADGTALLAAWSVNELDAAARRAALPLLIDAARRGAAVLIVEPISRRAVPWWPEWSATFAGAGGRSDEWTFTDRLPDPLAAIDEAAGFRREGLKARSLFLSPAKDAM
ncbi:MAG TPA: methyltransferase [Vicinamibacterales bacterium]|nr:methyltransferase [Vicinamibacterales bacterium]